MQEKNINNSFHIDSNIWQVEFECLYKFVHLFEIAFEDIVVSFSAYEIASKHIDPDDLDLWKIELLFKIEPNIEEISTIIHNILQINNNLNLKNQLKLGSNINEKKNYELNVDDQNIKIIVHKIQNTDWVSEMQKYYTPISIENIYISNSENIQNCPKNMTPIQIDASMAFGTGDHNTTKGCIEALLHFKEYFKNNSENDFKILDVGTGTGILSIISSKIWPNAKIFATEIDPIALDIAKNNSIINNSKIQFSDSYRDTSFPEQFDIIVANILAKPLIEMAPDFKNMIKNKGIVILSGLIDEQFENILSIYRKNQFDLYKKLNYNNWVVIILTSCK